MEQKELNTSISCLATTVKKIHLDNTLVQLPDSSYDNISYAIQVVETNKELMHKEKQIYLHDGVLRLTINIEIHRDDNRPGETHLEYVVEGMFMESTPMSDDEFRRALKIYGGQMLYDMTRADLMHLTSSIYAVGKCVLPPTEIGDFEE